MEDYEKTLVPLYAQHTVKQVRENEHLIEKHLGKSIDSLHLDANFPSAKEFVESQKLYIEEVLDSLTTPVKATQVAQCLKLLLGEVLPGVAGCPMFQRKMYVRKALLTAMFAADWSTEQVAHFEYMFKSMMCWRSFFLSYTNGNSSELNDRYRNIIVRGLSSNIKKSPRWLKENLLAEIVAQKLGTHNLDGFYDKKDIRLGQDLMNRIKPAVDNVFIFIQLVQTETFTFGSENWSFEEWRMFDAASSEKLADRQYFSQVFDDRLAPVFTNTREFLKPPVPVPEYKKWCDRLFSKVHNVELPTDPKAFDVVIRDLTARIVDLRHQIVSTVPV